MTNFNVSAERIEDLFEAISYNSPDSDNIQILREINEKLLEEQRENNSTTNQAQAKNGKNGKSSINRGSAKPQETTGAKAAAANVSEAYDNTPVQIFRKI